MKIFFSILIGKLFITLLKLNGKGGTALPGLVVEKINPHLMAQYRKNLGIVIAVTGTNGKTSTQTTLTYFLQHLQTGKVIANSRGANLRRGLLAEIIHRHRLFKNNYYDYSVLEVEEATLPKIISEIQPNYLIITNFFRDQLDAYGEIERTKQHIINAIKLFPQVKIIANADDPQTQSLLFQVKKELKFAPSLVSIKDFEKFITYEANPIKDFTTPNYVVTDISLNTDLKPLFILDESKYQLSLPGYHNIYSFALSYAVLARLNFIADRQKLVELANKIPVPFGRGEIIKGQQIFLIKNPVGFNLILDLLANLKESITLVILINDKIADGRDVSWLWDSNLEKLAKLKISKLYLSGTRANDMYLRIKYANPEVFAKSEIISALKELVNSLKDEENIKVLATYTAMNQYREIL